MKKLISYLFFGLVMISTVSSIAQVDRQQTYEEEIIRYLGYEETPVRYVSLPYDVAMNHNVSRNFMDIGFMLLMFVPLIFLWRTKKKSMKWILGLLIILMTMLTLGSSHILSEDGAKIFNKNNMLNEYLETMDGNIVQKGVAHVYAICGNIYEPVGRAISNMSSNGDQLTYLILIGILYFLYFIYSRFSTKKNEDFLLGLLLLFYCFFMLILSAGIIWYGFLMFPLLYLEIARYTDKSSAYRKLFLGAAGVFVVMAYFLKVSNLNTLHEKGMGMLQPPILSYNFSQVEGNEFYEGYYANIGPALDKINGDPDGLIFQAGTSLTFLIDKNNERVFKDGILHIFNQLVDKYKTKSVVSEALKASNFKYIIVSPNIINVDQTPEKSLTAKFQKDAWLCS